MAANNEYSSYYELAYISRGNVSAAKAQFLHQLSHEADTTAGSVRPAYHFLFEIDEEELPDTIVSRLVPQTYFLTHSRVACLMEFLFEDEYTFEELLERLDAGILPLIRAKDTIAPELAELLAPLCYNSPDSLLQKAALYRHAPHMLRQQCSEYAALLRTYRDGLYHSMAAFIAAGDEARLITVCTQHLQIAPRDPVPYNTLASIARKRGDRLQAKNFLELAYYYAADRSIVGQNLAQILQELGERERSASIMSALEQDRLTNADTSGKLPLVSFLVAAFNEERYIIECIESCLGQTYPNIEVCVVDDGSTDKTQELLQRHYRQNSRVKLHRQPRNMGKVKAFNAAYAMASGHYFALLGGDDAAYPDRIENSLRFLNRHGLDMVVGSLLYCDDAMNPLTKKPPVRRREDFVLEAFFLHNPTWGGTMFFNRNVARVALPIPETLLFEDWWIGFNACLNQLKIDFLPVNLIFYRIHGANDCANATPENRLMARVKDVRRHFSYYEAFKQRIAERTDLSPAEKERYSQLINEQVGLKNQLMAEHGHLLKTPASLQPSHQRKSAKILFVCHDFPPYKLAGAQLFALRLAQELQATGHDVSVFYPVNSSARRPGEDSTLYKIVRTVYENIPVYQITVDDHEASIYRHPQYCFSHPGVEEAFRGLLVAERIDIVHFHLLYRLSTRLPAIAKELGIPTVATLHDYWLLCAMGHLLDTRGQECTGPESPEKCAACFNGFREPADTRLVAFFRERAAATRAAHDAVDLTFSPSSFLADCHEAYNFSRPHILPLGWTPVRAVSPKPLRDTIVFGYLGQIIGRKGLDILLAATDQLTHKNWELRIHGEVHQAGYFEPLYEYIQNHPRIHYCGAYSSGDLERLYAEIDVAVVPSRRENYPLTVMEALSAQVPVIATDVGGTKEIMQDTQDGFIVQPQDPSALRAAMARFLADPGLVERIRATIQPIKTIKDNASEYETVYRLLMVNQLKQRVHHD